MDHDRGTYSPPTEDNLSYGGRAGRGRAADQAPLTLIISGIVLVLLLISVVIFYNSSLNARARLGHDVGDPVGQFKDGHVEEAKPLTDTAGLPSIDANGTTPRIVDETETPIDRSQITNEAPAPVAPRSDAIPSNRDAASKSDTGVTASPPADPQAVNTQTTPKSTPMPQAVALALTPEKPVATTKVPALPPKPLTAHTAEAALSPKTQAMSATGSFTVQIGAYKTHEIADSQFNQTRSSFSGLVTGTSKHIEAVDSNGGTLYRTAFTGFSTREKAKAFCAALSSSGKSCFVR